MYLFDSKSVLAKIFQVRLTFLKKSQTVLSLKELLLSMLRYTKLIVTIQKFKFLFGTDLGWNQIDPNWFGIDPKILSFFPNWIPIKRCSTILLFYHVFLAPVIPLTPPAPPGAPWRPPEKATVVLNHLIPSPSSWRLLRIHNTLFSCFIDVIGSESEKFSSSRYL